MPPGPSAMSTRLRSTPLMEYPAVPDLDVTNSPCGHAALRHGQASPHRRRPVQGLASTASTARKNPLWSATSCRKSGESWKRLGVKASARWSPRPCSSLPTALGCPLRQLLPCHLEPGAGAGRSGPGHERGYLRRRPRRRRRPPAHHYPGPRPGKEMTPPRRPDRAAQQGAISLKREPSEADRV